MCVWVGGLGLIQYCLSDDKLACLLTNTNGVNVNYIQVLLVLLLTIPQQVQLVPTHSQIRHVP